jgi:lysophospholipase L1-like esterase
VARRFNMELFSPTQVLYPKDSDQSLADFQYRFLAEGDSWFSIGAEVPWRTTNLLLEMSFTRRTCAINCAYPGDELSHMVDWIRSPHFSSLLLGPRAEKWDAILLSAGGNDLIDASLTFPSDRDGNLVPAQNRILLNRPERGNQDDVSRYVSDAGWTLLRNHLNELFLALIRLRDHDDCPNKGVSIYLHTYSYITPRNAPASWNFHIGPWLFRAFTAYGIPKNDWWSLFKYLIDLLGDFLISLNLPQMHVIETRKVTLKAPAIDSEARSGDWENEIHPTNAGYRKLANLWIKELEKRTVM